MIPSPHPERRPRDQVVGGEGPPARGLSHDGPRAGHIQCCFCTDLIAYDQYQDARVWTDPGGIVCAAHTACLVRLGEHELRLPPDPGEQP